MPKTPLIIAAGAALIGLTGCQETMTADEYLDEVIDAVGTVEFLSELVASAPNSSSAGAARTIAETFDDLPDAPDDFIFQLEFDRMKNTCAHSWGVAADVLEGPLTLAADERGANAIELCNDAMFDVTDAIGGA